MEEDYQVSGYRWVVLLAFMLMAFTAQLVWLSFAPVAGDAAMLYTDGDTEAIDLLAVVFMLIYIPVSFPASWCIDKFGLKIGTGIGVVLLGMSGFLRIFAPDYTWLLICQIGCSIGQPFILNSFTKVAAHWFPKKEEALAMGLGTMSMFVGLIIAMFATDFIMEYYKEIHDAQKGMDVILLIYGLFSLGATLFYIIFVKDKPKVPPNPMAAETKLAVFQGVKDLFKNKSFIFLTVAFFIGLGAFNAISSMVDTLFNREFDVETEIATGLLGGLIIVGGIFGAVILSAASDKLKKRKIFIMLSMGISAPMVLMLGYVPYFYLLVISSFIFGFFLVSALPIGLSYATEKTHPVPEATSNGLLMLSGQIGGIVLVLGFNMLLIAGLFALGFVLTALMEEIKQNDLPNND